MSTENITTEAAPVSIALDQPRVIRLVISGKPVDFTVARIPDAGWKKCLLAIRSRVEQKLVFPDGEDKPGVQQRTSIDDEDTALVGLFNYVLKVTGYAGTEGLGDTEIKNRVPMRHRLAVTQILRAVSTSTNSVPTLSDLASVELEAPWTVGADGGMQLFTGLVHRFKQPTLDQYRRWRMGINRAVTTGDATNGVTEYPSRLAIALGLYDEMIAEVEGYSLGGNPVTDVKAIQEHMDGMHKARAVRELFERDDEDIAVAGPQLVKPEAEVEGTEPEASDAAA